MKKLKKDAKGITLVTLIITIIVILILVSIATYSGSEVIKYSKLTAFTTEMKIMQTQVNELYEKYKNGDTEILDLGKDINTVQTQADIVFNLGASGITEENGYRYFDHETIQELDIDGIKEEFFINIEKRSVVSYKGLKYDSEIYYTLEQLPNGLYNVDYKNKNTGMPIFDTNVEKIGENEWKVSISNIQYNEGYIDKWKVKYKLINQENWNTSEDLSFVVNKEGNYIIKIVNESIESEEKFKRVDSYIEKGLILRYDGISKTRRGDNLEPEIWEDLSGNNNDGTVNGSAVWEDNKLICDGVDDYIDTGIKQSSLGQEITIQTLVNFYEIANYRGLYGYHEGGTEWNGFTGQCLNGIVRFSMFYGTGLSSCGVEVSKDALLNKETQITVVMEGGKGLKLYLDGEFIQEDTTIYNIKPRDDYNFIIAKSFPDNNRYFKGTISNFKIYSRILTDEEIQHNYEIDKVRFNIEENE